MAVTHLFTNFRHKQGKRAGRGIAANLGKTAGRGTKGQKARAGSGRKISAWFEGGQTPLFRKLAKSRGFKTYGNVSKVLAISTDLLNHHYKDDEVVSTETLVEKKIIRRSQAKNGVKIVLRSPLKVKITYSGVATSKSLTNE
ncbi:MAG TPA: 50S ribosomal protein L15 [Candidatus Saccharimonadales bacterium]|nr:50S ribosomal protein L15 [Candidatus Saccharimonadales bacterium]